MNEEDFGWKSTGEVVASKFGSHAAGKTFLITGANTGLGFETARVLGLCSGTTVIITCRSEKVCKETLEKLSSLAPSGAYRSFAVDLGSLKSIRSFVKSYIDACLPLHVLICNAGIMAVPEKKMTEDGFESQIGVNHFGHFALFSGLIQVLKASGNFLEPARVVVLSSMAHYIFVPESGVDFDNINFENEGSYSPFLAYGNSKLANVLFAKELNRR